MPAQLGVAHCPCAGTVDDATYRRSVDLVLRAVRTEPMLLLEPLADRVATLAGAERYEEAATVRDRAAALSEALRRTRRFDALRAAGQVELRLPGGMEVVLERGVLRACRAEGQLPVTGGIGRGLVPEPPAPPPAGEALPAEAADELVAVAQFLDRYASRVRLLSVSGHWATPVPRLPTFRPTKRT